MRVLYGRVSLGSGLVRVAVALLCSLCLAGMCRRRIYFHSKLLRMATCSDYFTSLQVSEVQEIGR